MSTHSNSQFNNCPKNCTCLMNHIPTLNKPTRHWGSCIQSVVNPFGDEFIQALYLFCCHYHSGQWSKGYRLLCLTQQYAERWDISLDETLTINAQCLYDYFVEKYRRRV